MIEKQSNNQKGGARPGAGRKKGEPNKRTAEAQAKAEATGITPLEYMLSVMRDSSDERMRMSAAVAAAPYVHAKLSSVELAGTGANGAIMVDQEIVIRLVEPSAS